MEKFYSHDLKCMIKQISKQKAKKLYDNGEMVFFQSSKMSFDGVWQSPMRAQKDIPAFSEYSFETICNHYMYYNCDSERGKYIHFYVRC